MIPIGNCSDLVNQDTTVPQVIIINPINGSTVNDTVLIKAVVTDYNELESVDFYLDNDLVDSIIKIPYEVNWETKESSNTNHTIYIIARSSSGNEVQSDTISVTVYNPFEFSEEEMTFTNSFGQELAGTLFKVEDTRIAVVMGHSFVSGESQTGLYPIARKVAELGFTVLTFDFPGYGKSEGPPKYYQVQLDVKSAIDFLLNNNYSEIASLGVGLGGLGCAKMAPELTSLITIPIPLNIPGILTILPEDLSNSYHKLFISAEDDYANNRPFAQNAETLYDYAVEPKELKIFTGSYHSMQLFRSEHRSQLMNIILIFFKELL